MDRPFVALMASAFLVVGVSTLLILNARQDRGWIGETETSEGARWPVHALPLRLVVQEDAEEWGPALDAAAATWNAVANRTLIQVVRWDETLLGRPGVVPVSLIDQRTATDTGPSAWPHTTLRQAPDGLVRGSALHLPAGVLWEDRRRRIAAHEVGHVLGLDHDDDEQSVMYPRAFAPNGATGTWSVSPADQVRLQERYRR